MTKVSVVIPLYNKAGTARRAVESVLRQSFADFVLHIVDDGSTDDSLAELAEVADPRIEILRQANHGPGAARNRGARASETPLLAFLDADDEWEADYLKTAVEHLEMAADADAHVCAYFTGPEKKSTEPENLARGMRPGPWRIEASSPPKETKRQVDFCHSSCVVVRRGIFERYGGFYDKTRCLYGEDSYLWLMLVMNHSLFLDPRPLVWFHTEESALGARMRGNHPLRPALSDPEPLRRQCDPSRRAVLEDLLALYRLIETEKLARRGERREIDALRRKFPWPSRIDFALRKRELKVEVRRLLSAIG
jgi:glycosyltransferase involved in cell wall biosynthesis